jgi:hypothetical protein
MHEPLSVLMASGSSFAQSTGAAMAPLGTSPMLSDEVRLYH